MTKIFKKICKIFDRDIRSVNYMNIKQLRINFKNLFLIEILIEYIIYTL